MNEVEISEKRILKKILGPRKLQNGFYRIRSNYELYKGNIFEEFNN